MKIPAGTPDWFLMYVMLPLCIVGIVLALYGIFRKVPEVSRECRKCKHGEVNFWGYVECWKFNQEIDCSTTSQTADREITAMRLNISGNCQHYE